MTRLSAADQAARTARIAAIRVCRFCDPCGWRLDANREPIEPAVRCTHNAPAPIRDITEPLHEPDLFDDPETAP